MVDVTNKNFDILLDDILADIKSSSFIAVDAEFTGLLVDPAYKYSYFDYGKVRYQKLCANLRRVTICQIGLSVFKGVLHSNEYNVTNYNFYLSPSSSITYDPAFVCQTSSIEFLKKFNFDFNKWLYEGIPFLNEDSTKLLQEDLFAIVKGEKTFDISYEVHDYLNEIVIWAQDAEEGDTMSLNMKNSLTDRFLLITQIRWRFKDLWTEDDNGEVTVMKMSEDKKAILLKQDPDGELMVKNHINRMLGFTNIIHHISKCNKPIVFHNGILDIMLLYKEFCRNLPDSYSEFKRSLHEMFPLIYDTKYIASEMKFLFKAKEKPVSALNSSNLKLLATSLKEDEGILYYPTISHLVSEKYSKGDFFHEAGYDAFLTGFCFLRLSHFYAMTQLPLRENHRPMSPREHVFSLKAFANAVMIARSGIKCMNICGRDPRFERPPWLIVEARNNSKISPGMVHAALARYGSSAFDVETHSKKSVLVASPSWNGTNTILKHFKNDTHLRAMRYGHFKHLRLTRTLAWSGALVSTGLSAWFLYSVWKKSS